MPVPNFNRRGAALPIAILWTLLLTVGLMAGLSRLSAERRTQTNHQAEVDAYALARAGLDRYFEVASSAPGASFDTTITGMPGGSVTVSVRRLRQASGGVRAMYVVRAHANHTGTLRYDNRTGAARRSLTQFATWEPGSMNVQSAWTAITGLTKNGGSGTLSGADACGVASPVAGVAVPTTAQGGGAGYAQNGGSSVPSGSPNIDYLGSTPTDMAPNVKIDWSGIVSGGALPAQYVLTGTSGWPSSTASFPTIYINNWNTGTNSPTSVTLGPGQSGSGLLVIRGNAVLNGSFSWNGVILVGGTLTSNGNNTVNGAVISGLNVKLGLTVGTSSVGNGTKTFRYHSCHINSALNGLGGLAAISNAKADNWPVY